VRVFKFEDIGEDLPLLPLAARRALDAAGRKLSLKAWQALPLQARRELVRQGSGERVDIEAVRAAIRTAVPPATTMPDDDESRLASPSSELLSAVRHAAGNQALDPHRWASLGPLERFALVHLVKRGQEGRLREACDEILGTGLTHLSPAGEAQMVDIGEKDVTQRRALAQARVRMTPATARRIVEASGPKGDVLAVARIAAIMAAKRTSELIPLCHPVALSRVALSFDVDVDGGSVVIKAAADARDRTGVEMEAMVAASVAALTIYDMLKAVERGISIEEVVLLEKSGGRSGHYRREPGP
jgi:cyclic pyranopterin phosphate synthase